MSQPWIVLAAIVAVGVLYVLLPVVAGVYRRYRAPRALRCPETGETAEVGVDARRAALGAAFGEPRLRVARCSRWPERHGCDEACLGAEAASGSAAR